MIFYFTATGNCLHVARELAREGEEVRSIPTELRREGERSIPTELRRGGELSYADDAIGIVYPIYGHMMPEMVRTFVEHARFETPYLYFICTYGNRHANAAELCEQEARAAGLDPAYISTLLMVDNWLPAFDMNDQRARIPEKRIDENLARIKADIAARRRWIEPVTDEGRTAHAQFMSRGLAFSPAHLTNFLAIDAERCIGCGVCTQVCPAGCIALEGGKAVRRAEAGFGCNACLACIHACPAKAITLPGGEVNPKARFRNEHVTLRDIECANSGR